jgi:multidrug resistance efflux pump
MKMFKRIAMAIALLAWAAGAWWLSGGQFERSTDAAFVAGAIAALCFGIIFIGPPWE